MKFNKSASLITALALMLSPMAANAAAEAQDPVFQQFNKNEVNGTVTVSIPEGCTADINITFDSPEGLAFPYYKLESAKSGDYSFDIEGRDNTASDYRYYTMTIQLSSADSGLSADPYKDIINGTGADSFLIPDKNDNPNSFKKYTYKFNADDKESEKSWEVTYSDKTSKTITVHLSFSIEGDVNGDGKVDGIDATAILTAYALESVNKDSGLTDAQRKLADINGDKIMDGNDASLLLSYYTYTSVNGDMPIADFIEKRKN